MTLNTFLMGTITPFGDFTFFVPHVIDTVDNAILIKHQNDGIN